MNKKRFLRAIAIVIVLVLACSPAFAQKRTLSGIVSDQNGVPLANATVAVKGEKTATSTDANGTFKITVSTANARLLVSYVGAKDQEITTEGKTTIVASLTVADTKLSEVVVIGYGTAKKANVSSAISSVNAKELKDLPVAGIDQAIQGKVAGVTVTNNSGQPGGGVSIKVRGITTINSNDPLIVIDGVPFVSNTANSSGYAGLGGANGQTGNSVMASINMNDVESVDILKDASAQAIYGSQAANGVILITTKKGKSGEGKISYDVYYGKSEIVKKLDLMNLQEFATYQNQVANVPSPEFADPSVLGRGTDWQDAMFRTGQVQNHQLSFSGGSDRTNYYFSLNYFDQTGTLIGSDFQRFSTRFNLDHQLKSWLKVGISSNASKSIQYIALADAAPGAIWDMSILNPLIPVKNIDGSWGGGNSNLIPGLQSGIDNPVANTEMRRTKRNNTQVFGNIYADVKLNKDFNIKNEVSYSFGINGNLAYQLAGNVGPRTLASKLSDYRGNSYYYALRNYLNYNKFFGRHSINATVGHESQYSYYEAISGTKLNLANNILDLNAGSSTQTEWELNGGKNEWTMESYFARANYAFDNRYAVSLSIRADGSSNFGTNNKWGYFPGASVAWTITNERFAEKIKSFANYLKLRVGYGAVGNQNLPSGAQNPPYTSAIGFWPGPVGFGTSSYLNGIANPDLSWEHVITKNIGLDASILNGRIDFSVDVYNKTTSKMLLFLTGPRLIGVGDSWDDLKAPIGNVGEMSNKGVDFTITSNNMKTKDFTWKTNVVFSSFKNKLEKMANSTAGLAGKVYFDNYTLTYTKVGFPVGSFYGLKTDGLFRTQAELNASMPQFGYPVDQTHTWLGDIRFKDINGDNKIDENDITNIGSPLPKFTYGMTNSFTYKDFDASIFVQGSYGAKIFNFLRWRLEKMDDPYFNQLRSVLNRYTPNKTDGDLPRYVTGQVNNIAMSDRYVEDGSYLRIQNISVGYRIPKKLLSKAKINNMRVYVSVQNLKTFSDYRGMDPEVGAFNNNIRLMNVDQGHYPNPRSFTAGVNIEL
jgi:TonB-dependent starch-binding outer membrane protein SusC